MDIKIKRVDKSLPLPEYKTSGSIAFDMYSREEMKIAPKSLALLPSNFIIKTPESHGLILSARSSLAKKKGLMLANGVGTIDRDYCGDNDEILLSVYNFTDEEVVVEKGERVAQGMFIRIDSGNFVEVEKMEEGNRGGFGSTGSF